MKEATIEETNGEKKKMKYLIWNDIVRARMRRHTADCVRVVDL